jgi:23S rRNA pseudouridine2605 synthase
MKRQWMVLLVAALAAAMIMSSAWAADDGPGAGRPPRPDGDRPTRPEGARPGARRPGGPGRPPMMRIPDLTKDQKAAIGKIREAAMAKIRAIQKKMMEDIKAKLTKAQIKAMEAARKEGGDYKPGGPRGGGDYKPGGPRGGGDYKPGGPRGGGDYKPGGPRGGGDRPKRPDSE